MARFDVYRSRSGEDVLLDCQSDLLDHFQTRFVVPLMPTGTARTTDRLHPTFSIDGQSMIMATQLAAAIDTSELGSRLTNLSERHDEIISALDMLISGF